MAKDLFEGLFTISDVTSEERYDLAKFFPWKEDTYDVLNSPFVTALCQLPVWRYYRCIDGFKDIDLISTDAYTTPVYSSLIQIYNGTTQETFTEDDVLKLFNVEDVEKLYADIVDNNLDSLG